MNLFFFFFLFWGINGNDTKPTRRVACIENSTSTMITIEPCFLVAKQQMKQIMLNFNETVSDSEAERCAIETSVTQQVTLTPFVSAEDQFTVMTVVI